MSIPKTIAECVRDITLECLFTKEELPDGKVPENAIVVHGLTRTFCLHPERTMECALRIEAVLRCMRSEFFQSIGGGASFLSLCVDREGKQWGEHRDCEALVVLAIAVGLGRYTFEDRELWKSCPGGMPYIVFEIKTRACESAA